ncbi:hypothetical protein [Streptomyces sp. NPDC094468]|uniref:hypothetical protein n=1 Tax=Streptomyces sp. NPDC094468 TaxID=3366066 RepID=UPI0037F97697
MPSPSSAVRRSSFSFAARRRVLSSHAPSGRLLAVAVPGDLDVLAGHLAAYGRGHAARVRTGRAACA